MAYGLTNEGKREVLLTYFGSGDLEVGLYNDSNDQLTDTSTTGDITEPAGSQYARSPIPATDVSVSTSNGDTEITVGSQFFDVSDSTMNVDSYFFVNDDGELVHREGIDTSDRTTDYIDLDQNDDLLIGGDPIQIG